METSGVEEPLARDMILDQERQARKAAEDVSGRLSFVLGAGQLLSKSLDLDETLGSLVRLAVPALGDLCLIDLVAEDGGVRRAAVAHADPEVAAGALEALTRYTPDLGGSHPVAEVLRTGHPELVAEVRPGSLEASADNAQHQRAIEELGFCSYMVVPLVGRNSTIGTVMLVSTSPERRFGPGDVSLAEDVARAAAMAIDTAQLVASANLALERERGARADAEMAELRLGVLAEVSAALSGILDPDAALDRLAHLVVPRLADWCAVDLLDDEGGVRRVSVTSADPTQAGRMSSPLDESRLESFPDSPLGLVRREGHPVLLPDVAGEELVPGSCEPTQLEAYRRLGIRSALSVPLPGRHHLLGALTMAWAGSERRFDETDLPMAADLGQRAGLALENAHLYQEKRNVAETLQHALLPGVAPGVPGLATAVRYVAATSGAEVGGDWYEVMELADGRVGIAIGDAIGHGMEAAAIMGTVRNVLRGHAWSGASPAEVVDRLDHFLAGAEPTHLATLVYASYEPGSRLLRWANAGHPPPLLVGPGPTAIFLAGGHASMVGVGLGAGGEGEMTLPVGATLVLYTDGLIEDRSSSLDDGFDRLAKVAAAHFDADPESLVDHILQPLRTGERLEDDVALLAARVGG